MTLVSKTYLSSSGAVKKLISGNDRFINNQTQNRVFSPHLNKSQPFSQTPFAVVLGCSDSRVPVEMIFDQHLGDLFIIRIAGNIAAPSQIGSIELAIAKFGVPLVVVLGHAHCGAIAASIDECRDQKSLSKNINFITDRIKPSVIPWLNTGLSNEDLTKKVVEVNIQNSINELQQCSSIIATAIKAEKVQIVGAYYCLETGKVLFNE